MYDEFKQGCLSIGQTERYETKTLLKKKVTLEKNIVSVLLLMEFYENDPCSFDICMPGSNT